MSPRKAKYMAKAAKGYESHKKDKATRDMSKRITSDHYVPCYWCRPNRFTRASRRDSEGETKKTHEEYGQTPSIHTTKNAEKGQQTQTQVEESSLEEKEETPRLVELVFRLE